MSVEVSVVSTVTVPTYVEFSDLEARVDTLESASGVPGPAGANGLSAYEVAVANGFVGTQTEWLASLVGEPGLDGAAGPTGPQGLQGETGPQGPIGQTGATGSTGATGATGPQGPQGVAGPAGPGLPPGGTAGQMPRKKTGIDYDVEWVTPTGGATTTPRPMYLSVASIDAPADFREGADYKCTGTNDQILINEALDRAAPLSSRNSAMPLSAQQLGMVRLSGGIFNCTAPVGARTAAELVGCGWATELKSIAMGAVGLIENVQANDHLIHISHLRLNGNYSAGGSSHGIDIDMSGATGTTGYPSSSPDSYHNINDIFIDGFKTNGVIRHGIREWASTTTNNRGNIISNCQIKNVSGDGIHLSSASDSFIYATHIGGVVGSGIRIATGNTKIFGCKTFYCDTYGFYATSGRGTITGFESQDDATGMYFDATQWAAAGITVDTSLNAGIRLGAGQIALNGFNIFNRSGGLYPTQTNGLQIDAAHTDLNLTGNVVPTAITNRIVGAPGARTFARVSDGTQLWSVG